jgi:hypothetical protein
MNVAVPANARETPGAPAGAGHVAAGEKTWRDVAQPLPLVVGFVVSVVSTVVQLLSTYDGFFADAIGTWAAWVLIVANAVVTMALMVAGHVVQAAERPPVRAHHRADVAGAPRDRPGVAPLRGAEQVGEGEKLNIGILQTTLEKALTDRIDDPVEDAKRTEIGELRSRYPAENDLPQFRRDLDENLRTDGDVSDAQVREIAIGVYGTVGRDPIKDLLAQP